MPNENDVSLSLRYQLYPRFWSLSRAQKKLWGGGNTAMEPALPRSAITRRLLVFSGASRSFLAPPNKYSCCVLVGSLQTRREPCSMARPFRPQSYLYATETGSVFAIAS